MSLPTPEQLQRAWVKLQAIHQEHLAVHDVCIPQVTRYSENSKATWLAILWHYQDQTIHKDEISAIVRRDIKGAAADQQVRHLKRDGWEIGQDQGQHRLDPSGPPKSSSTLPHDGACG